jgi:hypothetical protein
MACAADVGEVNSHPYWLSPQEDVTYLTVILEPDIKRKKLLKIKSRGKKWFLVHFNLSLYHVTVHHPVHLVPYSLE